MIFVHKYLAHCPPAISGQHGHDQTLKVAVALLHRKALAMIDYEPDREQTEAD